MLASEGSLPGSACGAAFLAELRPMMEAGVVARERAGGGWRVVVRDAGALEAILARRFPTGAGPETGRLGGVARYRDSKAVSNDTPPVVVARVFREVLRDGAGRGCGAVDATRRHGVFAFLLVPGCVHRAAGLVALVENPAVFLRCEELGLGEDMAIGVNGRADGRLLGWLAAQDDPGLRVLHLPDYDPTGLAEFERLREALGSRASLVVPGDIEDRFARHSNPRLLEGIQSRATLARLRGSALPEVRRVVALMDRHNAGLEQEALLIPAGP